MSRPMAVALSVTAAMTGLLMAVTAAGAVRAAEPAHTCDGLTATIVGTAEDDEITGTDGDDVIVGLAGRDTIEAGPGNDVVCGGDNADVLLGGPGADRLFGELEDTEPEGDVPLGGDSLRGGPGDDHLDPGRDPSGRPNRDQVRWGDSPRAVRLDLGDGVTGTSTGYGKDTLVLTGSPMLHTTRFDDVVSGSPLRDRVKTGSGSDTVYAGQGDDEVHVDAGPGDVRDVDLVQAGDGFDVVRSWAGRDRVLLGKGGDTFDGYGAQPVRVRGQRGLDHLSVRLGSEPGLLVHGDQGIDTVTLRLDSALSPQRRIAVDAARGRARIGSGPWAVVGSMRRHYLQGSGRWTFRGTPGGDHVVASSEAGTRLVARTFDGHDYLQGGNEDDFLDAGPGNDTALGLGGRDRCLHAERRDSCEVTS